MVNIIEAARKAAGISEFYRGAPPKGQRGVVFWARFTAAIQSEFNNAMAAETKLLHEHKLLAARVAELERDKATSGRQLMRFGVEKVATRLDLPVSNRQELIEACGSGN